MFIRNLIAGILLTVLGIGAAHAINGPRRAVILGGGSVPRWVVNPSNPPDVALNFSTNQAWNKSTGVTSTASSVLSVSRASVGYVNNSSGIWASVAANLPRISDLGLLVEEARTNSIRNNSMQGAVVMADDVELLTNGNFAAGSAGWTQHVGAGAISFTGGQLQLTGDGSTTNTYVAQQITGLTIGKNYIVSIAGIGSSAAVQVSVGTSPGDGSVVNANSLLGNGNNSASPDRIGFTAAQTSYWVTFAHLAVSTVIYTGFSVQDGERVENGGFTANPINAAQSTAQNGWQWVRDGGTSSLSWDGSSSVTLSPDGTNHVAFGVQVPTVAGFTYTITATFSGTSSSLLVGTSLNSGSLLNVNTGVGTNLKAQFTASSSSTFVTIRSNTGTSITIANVSVQSAGAVPTNWSLNNQSGLLATIVGVGAENGVACLDMHLIGTTTAVNPFLTLFYESTSQIAASNGQTWSNSVFSKLVAGSTTNLTFFGMNIRDLTAGGAALTTVAQALSTTATLTRGSLTTTLADATAAFVVPFVGYNFAISSAVDITIRIGWPQLELGASVTSPIVTTSSAATRAADVVTMTTPPTFGSAMTLFAIGANQAPNSYTGNRSLIAASDGTSSNRVGMFLANTSGSLNPFDVIAGVAATGQPSPIAAFAQNSSNKMASAFAVSDAALLANGGTPTTGNLSALPSGVVLSQVHLGDNGASVGQWDGFISQAAIWATQRVPNAQLQSMTQ